ncbi:mitogen-activated protein kinase 15 isoform X3 [Meles meles]|uniref:mitogen-activated protein kinase 15 isoform X3 n=1 Tax=Meles meles TaxID=9662 RepID=UPI001E69FBE5|nr:mitogen-activated protein kinase 15 isoform X3 [Meles meles]
MCAAEVDRHVAQRYLLKRRLGKGAYGIVWKAVDRRTGEVVAIKKIFDAFRDKTDAQRTFREITLLQELGDHPNIIRLLDVIRAENDRDIYLVFESMDTDLNAVICKGRLRKDTHKRFIIYQLLRATKFIHSGHVIHRDQKPSNVLLDSSCLVKLCDFGLARSLGGLPEGPEGQALTDYVATRWYRAPEVLLSSSWVPPPTRAPLPAPGTPPGWTCGVWAASWGRCFEEGPCSQARPRCTSWSSSWRPSHRRPRRTSWLLAQATVPRSCPAYGPGHGSRWTPSCRQTHPRRPWISSGASWYLPRTSGLAQPRRCSTPTCRGSTARPESGPWIRLCGSRCSKEFSSQPPSIAAASIRRRLRSQEPSAAELGPPAPASAPARSRESGEAPWGDAGGPLGTLVGEAQRQGGGALPGQAGRRPGGHPGPSPERLAPGPRAARERRATGELPGRPSRPLGRGVRRGLGPPLPLVPPLTPPLDRVQVPRGLPADGRPEPRPGRRMFSASASQGAQGAARAALGGYSQAYGTVCRSALGRLPLLPGPRA